MSAELKIDEKAFARALKTYQKATKKDAPRVLNHTATQAAFKGMQAKFTPIASAAWPLNASADPLRPRKKWKEKDRLYFALAQKAGTPGKAGASKIYRRRRSSRGFYRANFGNIVNKLGQKRARNSARRADVEVKRATTGSHIAKIANAALDGSGASKAEAKLSRGWMRAIREAVWGKNGMVEFAHKRIEENWKKSGRR